MVGKKVDGGDEDAIPNAMALPAKFPRRMNRMPYMHVTRNLGEFHWGIHT